MLLKCTVPNKEVMIIMNTNGLMGTTLDKYANALINLFNLEKK